MGTYLFVNTNGYSRQSVLKSQIVCPWVSSRNLSKFYLPTQCLPNRYFVLQSDEIVMEGGLYESLTHISRYLIRR